MFSKVNNYTNINADNDVNRDDVIKVSFILLKKRSPRLEITKT